MPHRHENIHRTLFSMFSLIPDGYLLEGLIAFDGPGGGYVAAGWWIDAPDLQTSAFSERNQAQDALAMILHQLPKGWAMQVRLVQDGSDGPRLLEYEAQTEACQHPATRLIRNANFLAQWQRLKERHLRRRRVALYIGRSLGANLLTPWKPSSGEAHYDRLLAEARLAFATWEQNLAEALHMIGARAIRMSDADHARQWSDALNPSTSERIQFDCAADYRLDRSLLENCWHSDLRGQNRQGISLDGWFIQTLTFKRLPGETYPTIIHKLTHLPFGDYTVVQQIRRLDKTDVLQRTQAALDRIHRQLTRKHDERLAVAKSQLEEKVRRLASGEIVPLEIELIIVIRAKTQAELSGKTAAVKSAIQGMNGAQYYEASLPATTRNLFIKSLPGWLWSRHKGFAFYVEDRTAADLGPFLCASFIGHAGPVEALFAGTDSNLVNFVTFLGEGDDATPQNLIIIGASGVGKSLMLLKWLLETANLYAFTAIIEEGLSQGPFTRSFGIAPIVFRLDGTQTINPLDTGQLPLSSFLRASLTAIVARMAGVPADEMLARRQTALIAKHVARLCEDHADDKLNSWPPERRRAVIRHALALHRWAKDNQISDFDAFVEFRELERQNPAKADILLALLTDHELREFESRHWGKVRDLVFAYLRPEEHLILSSLREYLELAQEDEDECRWLATLLTPWCQGGNCGGLFDGVSNVDLTGAVVHFELGLIPEAAKEIKAVVGFLIINGLRNHILSLPRLLKKRIVIEEISRFIDVPGGESILRELFEQFRKHRTQVTITAQSFSRIADTSIRVALIGSARAFALFNPGSRGDVERLGEEIALSTVAQEAILRFPRPDQQVGPKYSEFLYWHTDVRQPICGCVRYERLPDEISGFGITLNTSNHA